MQETRGNPTLPLDLEVPYNDDYSLTRNHDYKSRIITRTSLTNGGSGQTVNKNINTNLFHPPTTTVNNRKNHFLINTYNPNADPNQRIITRTRNVIGNVYDRNASQSNSNSTPNRETHVEIITKMAPPRRTSSLNLNVRNELNEQKQSFANSLYDRKNTCMLYLQADHTFFQKMGSDEASIEAITRHVQRANIIYRKTGEYQALLLYG
nr:uncharacterized protein LOC115256026 [Aedes albopictus]